MPYLTDGQIQKLVDKAVRKALRGTTSTNQEEVDQLVSNDEETNPGERQAGRHNPSGGFAAAAREVIQKSDKARQEQEKKMREHRGW